MFVISIVFIISVFSMESPSSSYLLLKSLLQASKEGKVSKIIGRIIVRRLKRYGIVSNPELLEVVNS